MKVFALLLVVAASSSAIATDKVPVKIGAAGPDIDACPSLGELKDRTVVRGRPDSGAATVIELTRGSRVHVCGTTKDGKWTSVVIALDGLIDCQVSTPVSRPQSYRGPCKSGWIATSVLRIVAG
jgi:hypothetical protein